MFFELFLGVLLGVFFGTITGLIPGVHINLVVAFFPFFVLFVPVPILFSFVIALAITHTFVDVIPAIFLGAPDEDTVLSVLPGHRLLRMGFGHQAVSLTLVGSVIAVVLFCCIVPLFFFVLPFVFPFVERMMGWFLLQFSLLLIFLERDLKIASLIIFLLAGFLGVVTLGLPLQEPLLPLLSGLFGASTLLYSIKTNTVVPRQIVRCVSLSKDDVCKPAIATALVSPVCSFFPGLGSSQSAIIGSRLFGKLSPRQFLVLIGSTNTLVIAISFITIVLLSKARTGAAHALGQIMQLSSVQILPIIVTVVLSAVIAVPLTLTLSKLTAKNIHKIVYTKISFVTVTLLTVLVISISGLLGFFVFVAATVTGLTCIYFGVRRGFLMGSLLIPTTLFYLPF